MVRQEGDAILSQPSLDKVTACVAENRQRHWLGGKDGNVSGDISLPHAFINQQSYLVRGGRAFIRQAKYANDNPPARKRLYCLCRFRYRPGIIDVEPGGFQARNLLRCQLCPQRHDDGVSHDLPAIYIYSRGLGIKRSNRPSNNLDTTLIQPGQFPLSCFKWGFAKQGPGFSKADDKVGRLIDQQDLISRIQ